MSPGLVRLCALAAMLGGGLWGAEAVLDAVAPPGRGDALFFVAPLLLLAGTAGPPPGAFFSYRGPVSLAPAVAAYLPAHGR